MGEEGKTMNLKNNTEEIYEVCKGLDPPLLALRMEKGTRVTSTKWKRPSEDSWQETETSFNFFKLIFIRVCLIYNVVLVSAVQQSESVIHIHISTLF